MKVKECLGLTAEKSCQDCARKTNLVNGPEAFMYPPINTETGNCQFYQMGEDQTDKRMNVVSSNGNGGEHYEDGYINFGLLMAILVGFVLIMLAAFCGGVAGGVWVK